jgi:probable F420-dependent oxidoreductase
MASQRPFRFAAQVSGARTRAEWAETARKAEDLGYATLSVPDHFGDQLAPLPALMAAADATSTLRIATLVLDNDFRHPVVLAKEAATLDLLSDGRLELGIGAGWMRSDYETSGIPYDPPGVRLARLEEALQVIKGLWGPEPFSFTGSHYRVSNLDGLPKPRQQPRPPILVGGGGRRALSLAARHADIVGVNFDLRAGAVTPEAIATGTAAATDAKVAWIRDAAGDRFGDLELQVTVFFAAVTDDPLGLASTMAPTVGLRPEEALEVPFFLAGSVEAIVETLQARRERWGFSYVAFSGGSMEAMAPVVARLAGT